MDFDKSKVFEIKRAWWGLYFKGYKFFESRNGKGKSDLKFLL